MTKAPVGVAIVVSPWSTVPLGGCVSVLSKRAEVYPTPMGVLRTPPCSFFAVAASVCRIRLESTSLAEIHPQKPLPVQVLVRGELLAFRIHDVCPHHAQHTLLGHAGKNGDSRGGHVWAFCTAPCPKFSGGHATPSQENGFDFLMNLGCSLARVPFWLTAVTAGI